MRMIIQRRRLVGMGALLSALFILAPGIAPRSEAFGDSKAENPASTSAHTVSYLREVRPILAQHCFQCHGPDEAARKGKLRLDLKEHALALRKGQPIFAPGKLQGSLAWERVTNNDENQRMPPKGKAEPLTARQIATLKAWI